MAFYIISVILLLAAIGVVGFLNPIYSALCLITNMLCVAALFALLDAHFLATTQIIVYAGAVVVLVLFVLMLLNLKTEPLKKQRFLLIVTSVTFAALFMGFLLPSITGYFSIFPDPNHEIPGTMEILGQELYTKYIFPFEAASILIMSAVAGAVMLSKRKGHA